MLGCSGPTEPDLGAGDVVLFHFDGGFPLVVDSRSQRVVGPIDMPSTVYPVNAVVADAETAYFAGDFADNSTKIAAVDLRARRLSWTFDIASGFDAIELNGVRLTENVETVALSRDGRTLYFAQAYRGAEPGLAGFDLAARTVTWFLPTSARLTAPIVLNAHSRPHADTVIALALPEERSQPSDSAVIIDVGDRGRLVGVVRAPPGSRYLSSLAKAAGGRIYVAGSASIGVYDLASKTYLAVIPRMGRGRGEVVASDDGLRVALPDGGNEPLLPIGLVPIYDGNLHLVATVDLRPLGAEVPPAAASGATFSRNGDRLFVSMGTGRFRRDAFSAEKARLVVASAVTGAIERVVEIDDFGPPRSPVLLPPL